MFIQTKRLYIREFEDYDKHALYKLDNNPQVVRYISSYKGKEIPLQACIATIKKQQFYYSINQGLGIWPVILKTTDEFIGWAALKYLDCSDDVEVGYRFMPQFWNKGYGTETTKALVKYGFDILNLNKICAVAMPENKASIRVMEKSGLKFIRNDKAYNRDVVYYEIERTPLSQ